jgi:hypothetical protein
VRAATCWLGVIALVVAGCGGAKSTTLERRLDDVVQAGVPGALVLVED